MSRARIVEAGRMSERQSTNALLQLADMLRDLARAMSEDQAAGMTSKRVVEFAAAAVPGADEAAISLITGTGAAKTVAASGKLAVELDRLQ